MSKGTVVKQSGTDVEGFTITLAIVFSIRASNYDNECKI